MANQDNLSPIRASNLQDQGWHFFAIRICLIIILLFFLYVAVRRGVAAAYFREGSPEAVQAARPRRRRGLPRGGLPRRGHAQLPGAARVEPS